MTRRYFVGAQHKDGKWSVFLRDGGQAGDTWVKGFTRYEDAEAYAGRRNATVITEPDCKFCTGSHWLSDREAFGPCVCCTPGALTQAEDERDELAATIETAGDFLTLYLVALGLNARPINLSDPDLRALSDILFY